MREQKMSPSYFYRDRYDDTNKNKHKQRISILCAYKFAVSNELK